MDLVSSLLGKRDGKGWIWVGVGVGVHSGKRGNIQGGFSHSFLSESSYLNYLVLKFLFYVDIFYRI